MLKAFLIILLASAAYGQVDWSADELPGRWYTYSKDRIQQTLKRQLNGNVAKNVIMFLGDGMGPSTVTSGRILAGQKKNKNGEETVTNMESFDHLALSKTYNIDAQTPDSAGTATAYLTGVKTRIGAIGVDGRGVDCKTALTSEVDSILQWAHYAGKSVGIVTTTRITHATPAGAYAHVYARDLEAYDSYFPPEDYTEGCRDIADQLITRHSYIDVILGGGLRKFIRRDADLNYLINGCNGDRLDSRNLIEEWKAKLADKRHTFITSRDELLSLNISDYDHLFGLFNCDHLSYEVDRVAQNPLREPSLVELTEVAIKMLSRNPNGYFLLVEGGRIDHGHHDGRAKRALEEFVVFDEAVGKALSMVDQQFTHITVTADHSHVFTIGGYAIRGNPLFGVVISNEEALTTNRTTFTSLLYGNGPGTLFSPRSTNLTNAETENNDYRQEAAVHISSETHGGEDVAIYGHGPMSYLYDGTVEQSHIAHVMAYSACIGPFNSTNDPNCPTNRGVLFASTTTPAPQTVPPTTTQPNNSVSSLASSLVLCLLSTIAAFYLF